MRSVYNPFMKEIMQNVRANRKKKVVKSTNAEVQALAQKLKKEMEEKRVNHEAEALDLGMALADLKIRKYLLIDQIKAIYDFHKWERLCERPLDTYSLGELTHHLENLQAGKFPWRTP